MKEYHFHPDKCFIIRNNGDIIACISEEEISKFSNLELPKGCTEVLFIENDLVYATINKEGCTLDENPLEELINKEKEIVEYYNNPPVEEKPVLEIVLEEKDE
jgi:hypothetical protein